ncbi:threonine/homoserine/homoserine lactone efflux protein [Natronobacillus azotifigens]|uniref:LysE family transporter n=1 Tax=Natronobacillus azotifigens TaxID=472978 RepID=A0A9J6R8J1_9BACI|nr:LysE family transporter [Natronobacillus azotifigens]MCZ0701960.1 LysE family transporter [Natronobacillus azotifigens]
MGTFFSYFLLGLTLAAPIGPINAAQINQGIKNGFFHSWAIGLGSIVGEFLFILSIFFGVVHFMEIPLMKTFLWSFGAFVLLYTAIENIVSIPQITESDEREKESIRKTFLSGFFITIANPLSILFWLGIYGSILADTIHRYDLQYVILYGVAVIIGLMLWDVTMAIISSGFRKILTPMLLKGISLVSGICLFAFAGYFGFQAIKLLLQF